MGVLIAPKKDYCVLIVDDEESLLNLYKTKLTREGFVLLSREMDLRRSLLPSVRTPILFSWT